MPKRRGEKAKPVVEGDKLVVRHNLNRNTVGEDLGVRVIELKKRMLTRLARGRG